MYLFSGILLLVCVFFYFLFWLRRRKLIRKVCSMGESEKLCLLEEITKPFGFVYCPGQNIMISTLDAWQREFGYQALFDRTAAHFNMVFDCEPVYFDYDNRTWLIEFWKGQYGINVGGEIGIYCADKLLSPEEYKSAWFHSVSDEELLPFSMEVYVKGKPLFEVKKLHWWLAGFSMGRFAEPRDILMRASVTFPNERMQECFAGALLRKGYGRDELIWAGRTLIFYFSCPRGEKRSHKRWYIRWVQWKNRLLCRLYRWITRPFTCTLDQMLYLYFYFPRAIRRMCLIKRNRKQRRKRRRS